MIQYSIRFVDHASQVADHDPRPGGKRLSGRTRKGNTYLRAALVQDAATAKLARQHNNANVLALGARSITSATARDVLMAFFATDFEGGRHARRARRHRNRHRVARRARRRHVELARRRHLRLGV